MTRSYSCATTLASTVAGVAVASTIAALHHLNSAPLSSLSSTICHEVLTTAASAFSCSLLSAPSLITSALTTASVTLYLHHRRRAQAAQPAPQARPVPLVPNRFGFLWFQQRPAVAIPPSRRNMYLHPIRNRAF